MNCPFCGSNKNKVESRITFKGYSDSVGMRVETVTGSVRCGKCHSRGPTVSVSLDLSKRLSQSYRAEMYDKLNSLAYAEWNKRIN